MHIEEQWQAYNMNEEIKYENGIDFEVEIEEDQELKEKLTAKEFMDLNGYTTQWVDDYNVVASDVDLESMTIAVDNPPNIFTINGENCEPLVTLHLDGNIEYGPSYTPNESAKIFWSAMCGYAPKNHFKEIEELEKLVATACEHGHYDFDEYMYGMANGLILALAAMKNEEPQYLDRPEQWLWSLNNTKEHPLGAAGEYGTQPEACAESEESIRSDDVVSSVRVEFGRRLEEEIQKESYERAMKEL